jgi:hypothetical protein
MNLDDVRQIRSRAIAIGAVNARGRASDITLHFPAATVPDFAQDQRVVRMRTYLDVGEALKAVGLEA